MLTPRAAQRAGHAREDASLPANNHGKHEVCASTQPIVQLIAGVELAMGSVFVSFDQMSRMSRAWVGGLIARSKGTHQSLGAICDEKTPVSHGKQALEVRMHRECLPWRLLTWMVAL